MPPHPLSLCERCRHMRVIESGRGSRFLLCQLSQQIPSWPKYPPQPLLRCSRFEPPTDDVTTAADETRHPH